ncbi:MAG: lipocalin family protein [Verrucomicrobiota bacterium]
MQSPVTRILSQIAASLLLALIATMSGCVSNQPPLPTPEKVDLEKFMGAWFVQGYTPILVDKKAHNAVEHYYLCPKGRIQTTYQFRDGGFDGALKTYKPKGFPDADDSSNAVWQMQFIWPFKADYVIMYLSEDYQNTIIAHPSRQYAWIMNRDTEMSDTLYNSLMEKLTDAGYQADAIQRLPQNWESDLERLKEIREVGSTAPLAER